MKASIPPSSSTLLAPQKTKLQSLSNEIGFELTVFATKSSTLHPLPSNIKKSFPSAAQGSNKHPVNMAYMAYTKYRRFAFGRRSASSCTFCSSTWCFTKQRHSDSDCYRLKSSFTFLAEHYVALLFLLVFSVKIKVPFREVCLNGQMAIMLAQLVTLLQVLHVWNISQKAFSEVLLPNPVTSFSTHHSRSVLRCGTFGSCGSPNFEAARPLFILGLSHYSG